MTMIRDTHYPALLTREEAARRCLIERLQGGIVVFTNGVFDILHRGHLEYLREAREMGSLLVVGLNSDESVKRIKGDSRPLCSVEDRAFGLTSLRFVDHVIVFDEDTPASLIEAVQPSLLVKGGDYKPEEIVGYDFVTRHGGKVLTIPLREGYSTTGFIERMLARSE
jgi:D-glycero-beta-D-manno-heptose 1-phosphate adenylyltransferase